MPNLSLFSKFDEEYFKEACRQYLKGKSDAIVAYLPLAVLYAERWQESTKEFFKGLAEVETVNAELMTLPEMESIVRRAALVCIPGGNTFLLNHRLHVSGLMPYLKKKVQAGLPVVAYSAGTILCGPNILTSKDLNTMGTPHFDGLNVVPFNFKPHYPLDGYGQSVVDDWLADYFFFNDNPVILMSDTAHIKMDGRKLTLIHGSAWLVRPDQEKQEIQEGALIV
jgi:dipeptidase E